MSRRPKRLRSRLAQISEQYPQDLSIAIASTAWQLTMEDAKADDSVRQLAVMVSDHPLEDIAEGRRPNSRQRREAAMLIPLWLVARECFDREELSESANQFGELALQAARRQVGIQEQSAILYEWGKILLEQGNKEEAEARWTELLELATQRPATFEEGWPSRRTSFHLPRNATRFAAAAMQFPRVVPVWLRFPVAIDCHAVDGPGRCCRCCAQPSNQPTGEDRTDTAAHVVAVSHRDHRCQVSGRAWHVGPVAKGRFRIVEGWLPRRRSGCRRPKRQRKSEDLSFLLDVPANTDPIEAEVVGSLKEIVQIWEARRVTPTKTPTTY